MKRRVMSFITVVGLFAGAAALAGSTSYPYPLMNYHDGAVLNSPKAGAIFWGPQWTNPSFAGDLVTGMNSFFSGYGGSRFASLVTEYWSNSGAIKSDLTYLGSVVDTTSPPATYTSSFGLQIVDEACKMVNNNPDPNAIYAVYTSNYPTGFEHCGQTFVSTCKGPRHTFPPIQVSFVANLAGKDWCGPVDNVTGHSPTLVKTANITSLILTASITNPRGQGWYDSNGDYIAGKCGHVFSPVPESFPNGTQWYLNMLWSNTAYSAGSGYANLNGQKGCLY